MNSSLERVLHTLEDRRPDRPPVVLHNFLMRGLYAGFSDLSEWLQDGEMIAAALNRIMADVPIYFHDRGPYLEKTASKDFDAHRQEIAQEIVKLSKSLSMQKER